MITGKRANTGPSSPRPTWIRELAGPVLLVAVALGLLRGHLVGSELFLGNFDRLGYFLSARLAELDAIRSQGHPTYWNDALFMGYNSADMPGATSPVAPMRLVTAFSSRSSFYFWAGVCVCGLMALTGISAYVCFRKLALGMVAATAGALAYMCSTHSMIRLAQTDTSSMLLVALPAGVWLIACAHRQNAHWHALSLVLIAALVFFSSTGPPTIYLHGLWCLVALIQWRRSQELAPVFVCGIGIICGLIIALPQVWGVAAELRGFVRDGGIGSSFDDVYAFFNVRPYEALRVLDEGIFGRFPAEVAYLGNNLNLSEGFQAYASTFATLGAIAILLRYRGEWFRLFKGRDGLFSVFAWLLIAVSLAILVKPIAELVFLAFFKAKLIHARLSLVASFALSVITGLAVQRCIELSVRAWRIGPIAMALPAAVAIALAAHCAATISIVPARIDLRHPWRQLAAAFRDGADPTPQVPEAVVAVRVEPRTIHLRWDHDGRPGTIYEVSMGRDKGPISVIGQTSSLAYAVGDIDQLADYWFSLRALDGTHASPPSKPVLATLYQEDGIDIRDDHPYPVWIQTSRLLTLLGVSITFGLLSLGVACNWRLTAFTALIFVGLVFSHIIIEADERWNTPENRSYPRPFFANNYFIAPSGVLNSNNPAVSAELHRLLEPERFRTVFLPEPGTFSHFVAPHMASYWRLRTVEGYLSGVPTRLAALPWPAGIAGFRTLSFTPDSALPWELLGLLNVRQALVVNSQLYLDSFHIAAGSPEIRADVYSPQVIRNPGPIVPREFFAERTQPAEPFVAGTKWALPSPADAWRQPQVEGVTAARTWSTNGTIHATYRGSQVEIDLSPDKESRFLVLNELYHPRWTARVDGRTATVLPVNLVMRGVEIPPGAIKVELEFVPYSRFRGWWLLPLAGTVAALLAAGSLPRIFAALNPVPADSNR